MDIREIRKSLGMTQQEFADAIGVDKTVVYKYERGLTKPSKKRIEQIDHLLKLNGDEDTVIEITRHDNNSQSRVVDNYIRRLIILGANGHCELCGKSAPFLDKDNRPFLCMHIVDNKNLKVDITQRCVALCPECNARVGALGSEEEIKILKDKAKQHYY